MSLRRQLPVYSPLSASALLSGAGAWFGGEASRRRLVEWLEREFETREPLLTDSGTTALALAMKASQGTSGRPVALPAYGCYDLVTAALGAGVAVRWYDLDPLTLAPDWRSLETALEAGAAAAVIVHFYGIPVDMRPVRELAQRFGALVIEDAAQGIGGSIDERPLGAFGDLAVLSFGRGKGLTGGGGGALLVNTETGRAALGGTSTFLEPGRSPFKTLIITAAQWSLARPSLYAIPSAIPFLRLGETVFRQPSAPRAINRAALGILARMMDRVGGEADVRRRNAAWIAARAGAVGRVPSGVAGRPGYLRLPVLLDKAVRSAADQAAARRLGILPGYPRGLNSLPGSTFSAGEFSGARELVASLVTFPVHSMVIERDRREIASWLAGQKIARVIE